MTDQADAREAIAALMAKYRLSLEVSRISSNPWMAAQPPIPMKHWSVTVLCRGQTLTTFPSSIQESMYGDPPPPDAVFLEFLASDMRDILPIESEVEWLAARGIPPTDPISERWIESLAKIHEIAESMSAIAEPGMLDELILIVSGPEAPQSGLNMAH